VMKTALRPPGRGRLADDQESHRSGSRRSYRRLPDKVPCLLPSQFNYVSAAQSSLPGETTAGGGLTTLTKPRLRRITQVAAVGLAGGNPTP
jgi:hypothetical protein